MTAFAMPWRFDTFRDDAGKARTPNGRRVSGSAETSELPLASAFDTELLASLARGDERALETIFAHYLVPLVRFADLTLGTSNGPAGVAGDLVSDVLVDLWARRTALSGVHNLRAYLYRAVRNRALNYRRGERRSEHRVETFGRAGEAVGTGTPLPRPDEQIESDERLSIVWRTVATLREPLRTIAILRWSNGMSFAEIAAVVGTSEGSIRAQTSRIVAVLQRTVPGLLR